MLVNAALLAILPLLLPFAGAHSHHDHEQQASQGANVNAKLDPEDPWAAYAEIPDLNYSGLTTFAHLPGARCLVDPSASFDIAMLGIPFDTAVSFRPGARFGPYGLRSGSRRQRPDRGYSSVLGVNPYMDGFGIMDCSDVPVSPFDKDIAMKQINAAYRSMLRRPVQNPSEFEKRGMAKGLDGEYHPRVIALGGDHTIVLPILEAVHEVYGPVSVIHFDAHIDTWNPDRYYGAVSAAAGTNHGTFFWKAYEKGYIRPSGSIHAGIRTKFSGPVDLEDDVTAGFELVHTGAIDDHGVEWIADKIKKRVGNGPVVISLDVDVMDPSVVPATGTPESGGWTSRELRRIIYALRGLNVVAFDVVELAPAYDTNAEISAIAAADMVYDFLALLTMGVDGSEEAQVAGRPVDEL